MPAKTKNHGLLYEQAAGFAKDLETSQTAALDQMLAAWTDSYWGIRQEMDVFLAKVEAAKAAGVTPSPAWAFQQQRLKNLLDTTKAQIARYAADASQVTEKAQAAAIQAAMKHAEKLAKTAVAQSLPGWEASLATVNPKVLEAGVGFLADGSVLRNHLALTMPAQAATKVQEALIHGLATGKSQDWMVRRATEALGLSHTRATTILRTESLRAYRHASRATYMANADVMDGWVWNAHLDSRTCVACALMDGTLHPLDATLDGHPRCRCAMIPRTKSWEDLGVTGVEDTRPPIRSGKEWLEGQSASVQRALMGGAKFDAWNKGAITLDDMVARTYSPQWGTMRTERSLKAILEDRNGNWFDTTATAVNVGPKPPPVPEMGYVKELADRHDLEYLKAWQATPGNSPQALANIQAAIDLAERRLAAAPKVVRAVADQAKVEAATAKLEKAVLEKGYPSKGYSQTQAIYKAQANGTVGQPVGVIKSLTWEQKVTAQAILEEHNAALPTLIRKWEKAQAIEQAHAEAIALNLVKDAEKAADDAVAALEKETQAWAAEGTSGDAYLQALAKEYQAIQHDLYLAGDDLLAKVVPQAKLKWLDAHAQALDDATETIQGNGWAGSTWKHTSGGIMEVDDKGWVTITNSEANITIHLGPDQFLKSTFTKPDSGWEQFVAPDPDQVKKFAATFTNTDTGLIQPKAYEYAKDSLENPSPWFTTQDQVNLKEALDQAWVSGKWEPEPQYVAKIKADLDAGAQTPENMQAIANLSSTKPLTKANINQALKEWQAEQIAKASIPVPKPAIDVAKIKWDKVSDTQVQKLVAKVEQGKATVDDYYTLFQASKNAGPKANYAKAILTLEGKGDAIPSALDEFTQGLADTMLADLKAGTTTVQDVQDAIGLYAPESPGGQAAKWALDHFQSAKSVPVTKIPTPPSDGPLWPSKPPWEPSALKDTGQVLGTHGARVYEAPDGTRWLFKPPKDAKDAFLTTLDEATARFQARVGLKAPDTYTVTLGGKRGSIQRMFPATDGFPGGFKPTSLTQADLDVVQREHALDWLLANHDGHRDQFLRLEDGTMVGIDKGQAFRWFGQDRLDWDFHPNQAYGAPEPVYNALWRDFAAGKDVELDPPGHGALWDQIKALQAVPDDELRAAFREYAEQAAHRGLLAKRQTFPGLNPSAALENDVEAFLDALVERKHNLEKDFRDLYERAVEARKKALPGWTPKAPAGVPKRIAHWVGKEKPTIPTPPVAPQAATKDLFTGWVQAAKDRLKAFNGKDLETSNNWVRFQKVIDDLDETAAKELLDRNYLRPEDYQEALDLIAKAKVERARLEGEFRQAMAAHEKLVKAYKKDLQDWKDANGVKDLTQGMDDGVLRHGTNDAGLRWAEKNWDGSVYKGSQRGWLRDYTGSYYNDLNAHLRRTGGKPTEMLDAVKHIDDAMAHIPVPEDVIIHRGVGAARYGEHQFTLNGVGFKETDDLTKLIGSVQVDHGYISTSVGNTAAFESHPIQLKIRAPQGTPASLVTSFSNYGTAERELILGRGQRMYVHNAYKQNGKWFLECEIVPADFDPIHATPTPSATPWTK